MERLLNERLIDEIDGGLGIRRLGALLLAKRMDEFPDLARKAPRVAGAADRCDYVADFLSLPMGGCEAGSSR